LLLIVIVGAYYRTAICAPSKAPRISDEQLDEFIVIYPPVLKLGRDVGYPIERASM
jgi:hypothetical protein